MKPRIQSMTWNTGRPPKFQNKTPEKELNKMEISNLSDVEFKILIIRMLKELIGYYNSIKKDPGRNEGYTK